MNLPLTLWRSVFREVLVCTLLALGALVLLMTVTVLLKDRELLRIVGGRGDALGSVLLAILPSYLGKIVPVAFVGGVLLALARISADGEVVAMRASGLGSSVFVVPVALLGLVVLALMALVIFDLEPRSYGELKLLRRQLVYSSAPIEPGRVRPMGEGRSIYIAESGDQECPLRGILISDHREPDAYWLSASCGRLIDASSGDQLELSLSRGEVHIAHPGSTYDRIAFTNSVVELNLDELNFFKKKLSHYPMSELLGSMIGSQYSRTRILSEIHQRLAFPFSGLVLGLLAVPLGIRPTRRGRSGALILAFVLVTAYWCGFSSAQVSADRGFVSPWVIWLPNAVTLAGAVVLLRWRAWSDV